MLIKFQNKYDIEIIYINNQPYFKAKDVCTVLGFKNHTNAVKTHCDKKGVASQKSLTMGGEQVINYINEPNLYALIFNVPKTFKTDTEGVKKVKERARLFQDWVFSEVLPSIRKTGKYELQQKLDDNLLRHLNTEIQKQNVKMINAVKIQEGGVGSVKNYHNEICKLHTGMTATEIKRKAKECGKFKSNVYNSARQVIREGSKSVAASMSVADQLAKANHTKPIEEICKIAKLSIPLFKAIEESGVEHNFAELKK